MKQEEIKNMTDRHLHALCQTCGSNIRKLQKEFAGYLCEVERRRLYKRYGFYSLYEYAAKLAGMSHAVVDEIMSIHKKLEDKPILKDLIAEQGWSKLKIVASSATPENQVFWAEKVREMSKSALETYVRELRKEEGVKDDGPFGMTSQVQLFTDTENISGLSPGISTPVAASQKSAITFKLDADTETKLRIFKQRCEKQTGEPQDWNQIMKKLLEITVQHEECRKKRNNKDKPVPSKEEIRQLLPQTAGRYIPASVKRYLVSEYKGGCAYPGCKKPAEIYHHTRRFALVPTHDPDYLFPLCKEHERLAHYGLIENEESTPESWKIRSAGVAAFTDDPHESAKIHIDRKVNGFRKPDG